jgi:hypothetical protein
MSNLPKVVFPVYWVSEELDLSPKLTNKIRYGLYLVMGINSAVKWMSLLVGLAGVGFSVYLYYAKEKSNVVKVQVGSRNGESPEKNLQLHENNGNQKETF